MPFLNMRRFSKSDKHNQVGAATQPHHVSQTTPPTSYMPDDGLNNNHTAYRPGSSSTNTSFEMTNRPASMQAPGVAAAPQDRLTHQVTPPSATGLSRTDQIVVRHFWDEKHRDNQSRDLHFVSTVPSGSGYQGHRATSFKAEQRDHH